jgi:glyoxylase-like metal-dependent hydrolase (beta-lactamase superfamily II)
MISGKYKIDAIDTGIFALDGGAMFGVVPKTLWSKAYHPGDELNRIPLAARVILIRFEDKNILIDTGNGTKYSQKFADRFAIDLKASDLTDSLANFDLKPEDISDVILTHLHFDHAGGATKLVDGFPQPTFPNAKYYIQKQHLEWAKAPKPKDKASFIEDDFIPVLNKGQMAELDGETEILPGISVIPVDGHTKSMQLIKIDTGREIFMYMADLCPTAAHIPYPYVMGYDNFPLTTIEEKKKLLPELAAKNAILIFEHDAFCQAAKIKEYKSGYTKSEEIVLTES